MGLKPPNQKEASRQQTILYVGLDVDDTRYHGSALNTHTGAVIAFHGRPTLKGLMAQLTKLARSFPGCSIRTCYEASYCGYTLQRDLIAHGIPCDIVAPSSIPSPRGKAVKTDRLDAGQLAQFYANDLVTMVHPPAVTQEEDRDLLQSRQNLLEHQTDLGRHLQALLRRHGLHYKAQTQNKSHWTTHHYGWLERPLAGLSGSLKVNLELLLRQYKSLDDILAEYRQQIEIMAHLPRYEKAVRSLICHKGIKQIFALTMITEIGDIQRFAHPGQLVSWMGMDIREYSFFQKYRLKFLFFD